MTMKPGRGREEGGLVRKAKIEYRIPSLKKKEVIVDIRRLVILPNLTL